MSVRNLRSMFEPGAVAVIGASSREGSVGQIVLRNLVGAGFHGELLPVNPKYETLSGRKCYPSIAALPQAPDLAVICTPAATVPSLIRQLGERGTRAAIVISTGLGNTVQGSGKTLRQEMLEAARPYLLRILGPNCVGLLIPRIGLNASFAHTSALPGKIAFVSQSGALVTGMLDWAGSRGIGFSAFVSLGDSADIDFGDMLDYLAGDPETAAILLYIEDIRHARKFMSAARAAARSKPVLVVKAGRVPEGATAAASHTGAMAGADDVYDAAIRRAGMVRVDSTAQLFGTVETLARARPLSGDRLAIITNGGGPGVMATDALVGSTGRLARLADDTVRRLDEVLPATWSRGNPVDIIGDAPAARYLAALEILLTDSQWDALLFIHAPTAVVPSADIARAILPLAAAGPRNVISCWLGGDALAEARHMFSAAGIPTYDTPEEAVAGFMQIVQYRRSQELLVQVPPAAPAGSRADRAHAQALVQAALDDGRDMLTEPEAKALLEAYGIPTVATGVAADGGEAVALAERIGFPVAVKVLSPDITHKTEVGGVVLDLDTPQAVRDAVLAIQQRVQALLPQARLRGFAVQAMARRPQAHELIVGASCDPVFGPVILFGQGGIAVEVTADHAVALPPLNMALARELVSRTRVARLLAGYRNRPPASMDAICDVLIRVSHLVTDLPGVLELDINPLLADSAGVLALDARVRVERTAPGTSGFDRLAIRPYPDELEERVPWQGGQVLLRPIQPEDAPQYAVFFQSLDPEDVRYRMFVRMRTLSPSQLARFTQIDYDREMAFIAAREDGQGGWELLGEARAIADPDNIVAEFAIVVRSDLKGQGLGRILMTKLLNYCRARGIREVTGEALAHNSRVLNLVAGLGFTITPADIETMSFRIEL
ncbi:GNAT family N-acetyltransferase [Pseudoduganella sp. GCM10020061]|uniref:bifunctional acetate--CoA ligase family protein/GNAT family N-acetyltransferase n=1 Tax=Pseudoduganella sp. GCM10020061 TaxID=3317345 RepID=UPI003631EAEB